MSDVRLRTITFLLSERDKLLNELDEVQLLLDLLDAGAEAPQPETSKHESGGAQRMKEVEAENRRLILGALGNGTARLTINQIAERVAMPASTVQAHVRALYAEGRLDRRSGSYNRETGGRVPYVYELVLTVEEREHVLDEKTRFVES